MPDFSPPRSRPLADIYADLRKPPAQKHLSTKDTGKFQATYMHHARVREYLDLYAPGWEWITIYFDANATLYCKGTLTIWGTDAHGVAYPVRRDGTGNEKDKVSGFGDPSSNAEAQALRRAAMAHGFCRGLWL